MPVPRGPWVMAQSWRDLLFAHWAVAPETLRAVVPPELELETFDGQAWLGVTPFVVRGLRPRFVPPLPGLSSFPEVNVRTYVTAGGRPGIWFLSLDAASRVAVQGARRSYHLPYFHARMRMDRSRGSFAQQRVRADARFDALLRPTGEPRRAPPGSP